VEGGERLGPLQIGLYVIVLLVQAPEDLQNKSTILHVLVEVTEVVSHPLHPAAVVVDAQIALHEEPKLCVEVESVCLVVAEELLLKGNPKLLSGAVAVTSTSGLLEDDGDGVEQPRQDHTIHPAPVGVVEGRSIGGDVDIEGVALERQQGPDVLDVDSLGMEVADGGSLERASYGGHLLWCRHWRRCCRRSRTRWRCCCSEDGDNLELEGGRSSSRLLGLNLDGGDARLKG
jgi:hypothetical protein